MTSFLKVLNKVLDKVPSVLSTKSHGDVLYHYTSQKGLLGIVKDRKLWATHMRYLNDSEEFNCALELAKSRLREECKCRDGDASKFANEALAELDDSTGSETPFAVYVASLSQNGNQLSQWRAYCPAAGGFSVGFRVKDLLSLAQKRSHEFDVAFVPCLYDKDQQNALISELMSTARTSQTQDAPAKSLFLFLMLKWAPAIKDGGFREEDEWRIVFRGTRYDSSFREGSSLLVPYIELDLAGKDNEGIDCIASVTVGPTPHPELSEQSVRDLLGRYNVKCDTTFRSEIPFRNW